MNLTEKDRQYVWHPFTQQKNMPDPIAITRGKGTILTDEQGNDYIDAISSWWVNLHGHAHPYIAEKLYRQALELEQVIFAGFTHRPAVELAERLVSILPGNMAKIFYSDNGSTSTEVALKMGLQYWWNKRDEGSLNDNNAPRRNKILAFKDAYHGDTFGAMSVSDRSVFTLAFHELLLEVIFIDTPTAQNIEQSIATINAYADEIAVFIYEPLVQGAGGIKMYDAVLLNQLLQTVKQNNILCIADEVMTGFWRTGKCFASEHMTETPDIICLSKGLTGGTMALGVTACTQKIYDAFVSDDALKTFFHGHSFTANPLACTAALASLDLLEEAETLAAIHRICAANKAFVPVLQNRQGNRYHIKNIRVLGTILAFELDEGKDEYLNKISHTITKRCLDAGVYLRPLGNTVYIMPPYCITEKELQQVYDTVISLVD